MKQLNELPRSEYVTLLACVSADLEQQTPDELKADLGSEIDLSPEEYGIRKGEGCKVIDLFLDELNHPERWNFTQDEQLSFDLARYDRAAEARGDLPVWKAVCKMADEMRNGQLAIW